MNKTSVRVVLLSSLYGAFLDENGSFGKCLGNYQRLKEYGAEIVFFTGYPLEQALQALKELTPPTPVIDGKGSAYIPEKHSLEGIFPGGKKYKTAVNAARGFLDALRAHNSIVIPVGIGGAESDFLRLTTLAALLPNSENPSLPETVSVYNCRKPGTQGWNEWVDLITRRIKIIEMKRGMRWIRK